MRTEILRKFKRKIHILLLTAGFLAACAPAAVQNLVVPTAGTNSSQEAPAPTTNGSSATVTDTPATPTTTKSTSENTDNPGEESTQAITPTPIKPLDPRFEDIVIRQLLPYDGILPIYEPQFVAAAEAPLSEDELVMGVAINGEAKAYPVTVLRFREMVDDELGGLPILVTW